MAPDPMVQRRKLRVELRKARVAADLRQADVAAVMDWSPSKVIRIETGQVVISTSDLLALAAFYRITDQNRVKALVELARSARGTSVYDLYSWLDPAFRDYLAYEGSASVIRQYDPTLVLGLLQTEAYAKEILRHSVWLDEGRIEQAWEVREYRQELHDRAPSPRMVLILDESAVRRTIGGPDLMREQLRRLRTVSGWEHMCLRILPFGCGAHPGLFGSFMLLEFDDPSLDDRVYTVDALEVPARGHSELVGRYLELFTRLETLALSPSESMALIEKLLQGLDA